MVTRCVRCGRIEPEHDRLDHRFDPPAPWWMRTLNRILARINGRSS